MTPMTAAPGPTPPEIVYPFSDGKPMAESIKQLRWMMLLIGNLCAQFRDRDDVFVAGDNFWYPVEGEPQIVFAPDVYVAFGRPKGDRLSYKQWEEGDVPLTVVFEILSHANTTAEMVRKFDFYDHYGVEEYYVHDPDRHTLLIYTRGLATLRRHRDIATFVSPRLGIRFEMTQPEMTVYGPDGKPFIPFEEQKQRADDATSDATKAKRQADDAKRQADDAKRQADDAKRQADDAKRQADDAKRQADDAKRKTADEAKRADIATQRAARLAELGRKARRGQATPEEVAELERLEDETL